MAVAHETQSAVVPTAVVPTAVAPMAAAAAPVWLVVVPPMLLAMILWATFVLKLRNLEHTALTRWDEAFHAVVAQNVLKHPLEPTLVDVPFLPFDAKKWGENRVWLHKPILPFWQAALSLALLGVSTFALRLPAVILSTGAAWLTYLIGRDLFDRRTALVAAALQAVSPFLMTLVHGYQFADSIDVALLFWVEVGFFFLFRALRTGSWRDVLLAGVAQGLAFLCKSYLAAIIFGVALTAWLLPMLWLARREDCRIGPARLLALLGASVAVALPWVAYCMVNYPEEFWHEHTQVWNHLSTNVENWQAPWDRLIFDYLIAIYGVFYGPVLVATAVLVVKALGERHAGLWLVYAWGLGVIVPHVLAVTKTPSATILAMPAFCLFGCLVSQAWRGDRLALAALVGAMALALVFPAVVRPPGHGYPSPRLPGRVMRQSMWVIYQVGGALIVAAVGGGLLRLVFGPCRRAGGVSDGLYRFVQVPAFVFGLGVMAWLGFLSIRAAWEVTDRNVNAPHWHDVGRFARSELPDNAVLLCTGESGEHLTAMFYSGRTCYPLAHAPGPDADAQRIVAKGGVPYVVVYRDLKLPQVHISGKGGLKVYRWQ